MDEETTEVLSLAASLLFLDFGGDADINWNYSNLRRKNGSWVQQCKLKRLMISFEASYVDAHSPGMIHDI